MTDQLGPESDATVVALGYIRCSDELSRDDPDGTWMPETNPNQRAYDIVNAAIRAGAAERAWELVRAILTQESDDRLAHQAAGPLEDLIRYRGAEVVPLIEREAATDDRFRWALGKVWIIARDLPEDVVKRLVIASGNVIQPA